MKVSTLILIILILFSILYGFKLWFTEFNTKFDQMITNQESIILLLSRDYPEKVIQKTKKNKVLIKKLKDLELEIQELLEN